MILSCPICGNPLVNENRSLRCSNRHSFDLAKSGYVNLLSGGGAHGDNDQMVKARTAFLNQGCYEFLRDQLKLELASEPVTTFADLGCGEGYYTSVIEAAEKYGFDLSRKAIDHAAKIDPSTQYAVAGIFRLPLPDQSLDAALTCFAPAAGDELDRTLKEHGRFVFVTPGPKHLYELKQVLYEHPYENPVKEPKLSLKQEKAYRIEQSFSADHDTLLNLFQMTPYAYKTGEAGIARLNELTELSITASFEIRVYRKSSSSS